MSWLLPLTTPEVILASLVIALFSSQDTLKFGVKNSLLATVTLAMTCLFHYFFIDDFFSMSIVSVILLAVTGLVVATKLPLPLIVKYLYSILFMVFYGLSFFERLFFMMTEQLILATILWFLVINLTVVYLHYRLRHKVTDTIVRVLGSWIAAAGILLFAFFI